MWRAPLVFALIAVYVYLRGARPLLSSRLARLAALLLVAGAALWPWLTLGGPLSALAAPWPRWLAILGSALEVALCLSFFLVLARDLLVLLAWLTRRRRLTRALLAPAAGAALWALVLALTGTLVFQGTRPPLTTRVEVPIPDLPPQLDGFTIAQLSDLHISSLFPGDVTRRTVAMTNALRPDLTVITGDIVDGRVRDRRRDVAPLSELTARWGVWACEGNHEHYVDYEGWTEYFRSSPIGWLNDSHAVIDVGGARLILAGLRDPAGQIRFGRPGPDLDRALAGAPAGVVVLLSHQPAPALGRVGRGLALQLSGHTHGGQMPGVASLTARGNEGFLRGLYRLRDVAGAPDMWLYVNQGTHLWSGLPARLGTRGEITLLTLRRAPGRAAPGSGAGLGPDR